MKTNRPFPRYTLKALLLVSTLSAVFFAWTALLHGRMSKERNNREYDHQLLSRMGGRISGWSDANFYRLGGLELWPRKNRGGASSVRFSGTRIDDDAQRREMLEFLTRNPNIDYLSFAKCVDVSGLIPHLRRLESLKILELENCGLSPEEVQAIRGSLPNVTLNIS
jgi:hypothetical protein